MIILGILIDPFPQYCHYCLVNIQLEAVDSVVLVDFSQEPHSHLSLSGTVEL